MSLMDSAPLLSVYLKKKTRQEISLLLQWPAKGLKRNHVSKFTYEGCIKGAIFLHFLHSLSEGGLTDNSHNFLPPG